MSESTCSACGVVIRDGSLFCYNCGGPVGGENAALESTSYTRNGPGKPVVNGTSTSDSRKRESRTSIRKRSKEPLQITWKRDENPGVGFLIVAIVAGAIAFGLLGIAYYLH